MPVIVVSAYISSFIHQNNLTRKPIFIKVRKLLKVTVCKWSSWAWGAILSSAEILLQKGLVQEEH